ncbi:MAG: glycosyltransferase [Anaerolineae bacterium]|nr:MAG: glycosyltransferase [Anaerolineae bacterium]
MTIMTRPAPTQLKQLADYQGVAPAGVLDEIYEKAGLLKGASMVHVNATAIGGGVAEILDNFVLLMNDAGVRTDWRVLHGTLDFFEITKKFHNTLQGNRELSFSEDELELYRIVNHRFASWADLDHDFVIIHDPQPAALVEYYDHSRPWVFRLHIDITDSNPQAFDFISLFIEQYERMIVSAEAYKRPDLGVPQQIISPSIDPLSPKNIDLSHEQRMEILRKYKVPTDKRFITQVSRFDPWKDPEGVLSVWERVRQQADVRLIFAYAMAPDDPEGARIYQSMAEVAADHLESGDVLFVQGDDPLLVNAIQSTADVVIQKSTREGFGLVITEAMWKGSPVVASNVGGIPTQIVDGESGFLVDPYDLDAVAETVLRLLNDEALAAEIGANARERVRERFLITRHMLDYLDLMLSL